jgi:hypothetical protein
MCRAGFRLPVELRVIHAVDEALLLLPTADWSLFGTRRDGLLCDELLVMLPVVGRKAIASAKPGCLASRVGCHMLVA